MASECHALKMHIFRISEVDGVTAHSMLQRQCRANQRISLRTPTEKNREGHPREMTSSSKFTFFRIPRFTMPYRINCTPSKVCVHNIPRPRKKSFQHVPFIDFPLPFVLGYTKNRQASCALRKPLQQLVWPVGRSPPPHHMACRTLLSSPSYGLSDTVACPTG